MTRIQTLYQAMPNGFVKRGLAAVSLGSMAATSWAQGVPNACQIALDYSASAVPPPVAAAITPVPSMTLIGVGVLGAVVALAAWRNKRLNQPMAVLLMASGVAAFSAGTGGSLIQAVRAAAPYEFSNAAGGTVSDAEIAFATPSPFISVTNTSGVSITLTGSANPAEAGTCVVGADLAPGASCTTQAVCPVVTPIEVLAAPTFACDTTALDNYSVQPALTIYSPTVYNYAPVVGVLPVYAPALGDITTTLTYVRTSSVAEYAGGLLVNGADLGTGVITFTATAPSGYGFGADLAPTMTWTPDYTCQNTVPGEAAPGQND